MPISCYLQAMANLVGKNPFMDVLFASLDHIVKHSMSLMGELINALQSKHIIKQLTISTKELFMCFLRCTSTIGRYYFPT